MTTIKQPVLIRKTIMTPNGLSLSLPDFKVNISKASKSSFEFYNKTKTVKRSLKIHHQSTIPEKSKIIFVIRNEWKRIENKCFKKISTKKNQNMFDDILVLSHFVIILVPLPKKKAVAVCNKLSTDGRMASRPNNNHHTFQLQ